MLTGLCAHNFKSWKDTGQVRVAPLTGLFGTNSSGKSAILQMLLLLKQTVESNDQSRVLNTGDANTYVDVGSVHDILHNKLSEGDLEFSLQWSTPEAIKFIFEESLEENEFLVAVAKNFSFNANIKVEQKKAYLQKFSYKLLTPQRTAELGLHRVDKKHSNKTSNYTFFSDGYTPKISFGLFPKGVTLPTLSLDHLQPVKFYGFPSEFSVFYSSLTRPFAQIEFEFETTLKNTYYLGPLRDFPHRIYLWSGQRPQDVGRRGEFAAEALLAEPNVIKRVAYWLKELKLVHDFSVKPLAKGRREHEVLIQSYEGGPQVPITDVGFGVSQLLPVLTLCYYVPEGATILFEQPEIHLHPSVQAGLADVFIDVMKHRNVQIILESHSEHLLQRLQRRIAEEELSKEQTALYFCHKNDKGESQMTTLDLDEYGNIRNWPPNFFGDEYGDVVARTEAAIKRQREKIAKTKSEQ